jgi:hypothetical protein
VSILNTENKDRSSLQVLKEDIQEVWLNSVFLAKLSPFN